MLLTGDEIRVKKPMGILDVGTVCTVISLGDNGVITFNFGGGGLYGCMSFDEFEKHFEKIDKSKTKPKLVWTKWKKDVLTFKYDDVIYHYDFFFKTNGKRVLMKTVDNIKSHATCHCDDEFVLMDGIDIAKKRLVPKLIKRIIDKQIAELY